VEPIARREQLEAIHSVQERLCCAKFAALIN